jgi:ABC-type Fe3+/spermidine/putrescine transport system ATPase subunit
VMMGLTPDEARSRVDAAIAFGGLGEFTELKLKNYSSGMLVRLAFSVMVQADTDILLIDEVLAVGDAAFQQKCADTFHEMREQGKTIVLVTHDMAAVERYCHRAMLLSEGRLVEIGDPGEVARRYLRLNFEELHQQTAARQDEVSDTTAMRLLDVWLEGSDGERIVNLEQGDPIRLRARLEALHEIPDPEFGFVIANANDVNVHEFLATLPDADSRPSLMPGQRVTVSVDARNDLPPGHYYVHHGVARHRNRYDTAFWAPHLLGFIIYGDSRTTGVVTTDHKMRVVFDEGDPE